MDMTIRQILTLLQSEYPQSFSRMDDRTMALKAELWEREFSADNPNLVYAAIRTYMRTPERFAPSIGQVREIMTSLTAGEELQAQDAWALVSKACQNGLYGYLEEYQKLPPDVQAAVGAPEQLKSWAMMDSDTVESVVASNFMRSFRAHKEREKARAALPKELKELLAQTANRAAQEREKEKALMPPEVRAFVAGVADKMNLGGGEQKAIADKPKPAALPVPLKPMTYQPQELPNPTPQPVKAEKNKPLPEDEWERRREELLRQLTGGNT